MKAAEKVPHVPGHQEASAVISAALGTVKFPATREDLITKIGGWPVPLDRATKVPFGEIAKLLPHERFDDLVEAQNEIDHHWADIRKLVAQNEGKK